MLNKDFDRQSNIDFLKFLGLSCIIIAHVGSPSPIMMLRSFDVPMMVILSSILAIKSYSKYKNHTNGPVRFFISRFKRLVFPTWIFLALNFLLIAIISGSLYDIKYYIDSFCLTRYGIGYVWVILIYLYSAMLVPVFSKLRFSAKSVISVLIVYISYEIVYYCGLGVTNRFIDTTIFYIIPYGFLTFLGCNYRSIKELNKWKVVIISAIVFVASGVFYWVNTGAPQLVQIAKYPPRIYYLSYGVMWSFLLLLLSERIYLKLFSHPLIRYISEHSLWIYLWHILALEAYSALNLPNIWYIKFFTVYIAALFIVFFVNLILDKIEKKHSIFFLKYFRG